MNRIKPDVDVIQDILKEALILQPQSTFIPSLLKQYQERGSLSKKQLQGLYDIAVKTGKISPGKIATLDAIISKKPTRYKSTLPAPEPEYKKDELTGKILQDILSRYPSHKRVIFLQSKYLNNDPLTIPEQTELQKFARLLTK